MLDQIRIVLVEPSHPGNIGAAARALKTMGLSQLVLVNPKSFPDKEATYRAAGADDLLESALVVESLSEGLAGCDWVIGASVRLRSLARNLYNPNSCAKAIRAEPGRSVAIVFGRESSGLTNEELSLCHDQVSIPANEVYSSLNLAAAIQVVCYELRMASLTGQIIESSVKVSESLASSDQLASFYEKLQETFVQLQFMNPDQPKRLMERMKLMFNRASLTVTELNILRGFLKAVGNKVDQ